MRIASIIVFMLVILWLVNWKLMFNCGGKTKLKLHLFRQVYLLNPDRWSYKYEALGDGYAHLYYQSDSLYLREYMVKLSFAAFLWFVYYQHIQNKRAAKKAQDKYLIHILENSQQDIDRLKAQSEEQIQSALEQQKKILKNWK